jgi:hypothetical protein
MHDNKRFAVEFSLLEGGQAIAITFPESDDNRGIARTQIWRKELDMNIPYNEAVCK